MVSSFFSLQPILCAFSPLSVSSCPPFLPFFPFVPLSLLCHLEFIEQEIADLYSVVFVLFRTSFQLNKPLAVSNGSSQCLDFDISTLTKSVSEGQEDPSLPHLPSQLLHVFLIKSHLVCQFSVPCCVFPNISAVKTTTCQRLLSGASVFSSCLGLGKNGNQYLGKSVGDVYQKLTEVLYFFGNVGVHHQDRSLLLCNWRSGCSSNDFEYEMYGMFLESCVVNRFIQKSWMLPQERSFKY